MKKRDSRSKKEAYILAKAKQETLNEIHIGHKKYRQQHKKDPQSIKRLPKWILSELVDNSIIAVDVRTMESGGWPNSYILCQWNSGSKQITFGGEDDNQENFGLGTGTNSIDINKWWFSTFTIDRDNNLETGYLNGEQVQQNSFSETFQGVNPTGSFRIPSSWTEYPGGIALTLMYEVALTATEVKQNYNALKGRFRL